MYFFIVSSNHGVKRAVVILFYDLSSWTASAGRPPTYCTYQSGNRLLVDQLLDGLVLIYECCMVAIRRHHGWDSQRQR